MQAFVTMQKGVSTFPEYEFMKPACDFNLTNVSEQTHLCRPDPWGEGFILGRCRWGWGVFCERKRLVFVPTTNQWEQSNRILFFFPEWTKERQKKGLSRTSSMGKIFYLSICGTFQTGGTLFPFVAGANRLWEEAAKKKRVNATKIK